MLKYIVMTIGALSVVGWAEGLVTAGENEFVVKERPIVIQEAAKDFPVGESLRYHVNWMGLPIGIGELQTDRITQANGEPAILITAKAWTVGLLRGLILVDDIMKSVVHPSGDYVLSSEKNLKEGRYRAHEKVDFDYQMNIGYFHSIWNGSKKEIPLDGFTHDVLSAFYWFRRQPAQVGAVLRTRVNADEKNWDLVVDVLRTERVEIRKLGSFDTFVVEPKGRFRGVFVRRGRAWVHFTADSRRIPLKIKMRTPFGPIIGVLEAIPKD